MRSSQKRFLSFPVMGAMDMVGVVLDGEEDEEDGRAKSG